MTPERWQQVARVYQSAMEQEPSTRGAYLTSVCGNDVELRREVESLLAQPSAPGLIDHPLVDVASAFGVATNLAPGTMVGPYRIAEHIGEGGMGQVYRAQDTNLGRQVAIKVLPAAFVQDRERLARFEREAKTLASLNDPHIAQIYGLERSGTMPALVMELVEGETLADRIARGPIPLDEALPLAKQIGEALEAAHEQGIIHRDLKPANIKVRPDGTVKVLDFGLAKLAEATPTAAAGTAQSPLSMSPTITSPAMTGVGVLLGTAAYMSPEQAKGRPADKRSDIWAFGCVLYEMLTGKRAFDGEDVADTLANVLKAQPDWQLLPSAMPTSIRRLVRRTLEKDRRRRLSDAAGVRLELDDALASHDQEESTTSTPVGSVARWRRVATYGLVALITAAVVGTVVWVRRPAAVTSPVARFSFSLPEGQTFGTLTRAVVAISPNGTQLVFVTNFRLYRRSISDLDAIPIPGTEMRDALNLNPVFSPDGRFIAFYSQSDSTLKRIGLDGGTPITICPVGNAPTGMSWSQEALLFGQGAGGMFRVSPDGGTPERIVRLNEDEFGSGPQMLPGGQAILFTVAKGNAADRWEKAKVVVQSLKTGERTTLVDGGSGGMYLATGHLLYALGGTIFAVSFDLNARKVVGAAVPVLQGVRRNGGNQGATQISVSDTGSLIYVPGPAQAVAGTRTLILTDRNGSATPLPVTPGPYLNPRVSRDGKHLVVESDDGREANVWVYEFSTSSAIRRLTFGGHNRFPTWSPDNQRVAFQSDREGDLAIFVQRADGSGAPERLTKPEPGVSHMPESWSPDGRTLLLSVRKGEAFSLDVLSLERKTISLFGNVQSGDPINATFSPDGRWIAYATSDQVGGVRSPNRGVYVQPFPATGARYQLPKEFNDFHPVWSPTGRELFYIPRVSRLSAVSVSTGPPLTFGRATNLPAPAMQDRISADVRDYDVLPDGRFISTAPDAGNGDSSSSPSSPQIRVILNWFTELKQRVPVK